jgi:hypothetical protein
MKDCPFKNEDYETCRWNFGHNKCGIFSIAADMSVWQRSRRERRPTG